MGPLEFCLSCVVCKQWWFSLLLCFVLKSYFYLMTLTRNSSAMLNQYGDIFVLLLFLEENLQTFHHGMDNCGRVISGLCAAEIDRILKEWYSLLPFLPLSFSPSLLLSLFLSPFHNCSLSLSFSGKGDIFTFTFLKWKENSMLYIHFINVQSTTICISSFYWAFE